jgi:hypothetical protein
MSFVTISDFEQLIQSSDLDIVLANNDSNITQSIFAAMSEVKSYIRHRYDVDRIFKTTNLFNIATTYAVDDLVEITATAYSSVTTYAKDSYVSYESDVYKCLANGTLNKVPTNTSYWTKIGKDKGLYVCIAIATAIDVNNRLYFIEAEDQQLLRTYVIDITLYHAHSRIQPRNIPEWRIQRRDDAIDFLKQIKKGDITMSLPIYSDATVGQRISYGGNDKIENYF